MTKFNRSTIISDMMKNNPSLFHKFGKDAKFHFMIQMAEKVIQLSRNPNCSHSTLYDAIKDSDVGRAPFYTEYAEVKNQIEDLRQWDIRPYEDRLTVSGFTAEAELNERAIDFDTVITETSTAYHRKALGAKCPAAFAREIQFKIDREMDRGKKAVFAEYVAPKDMVGWPSRFERFFHPERSAQRIHTCNEMAGYLNDRWNDAAETYRASLKIKTLETRASQLGSLIKFYQPYQDTIDGIAKNLRQAQAQQTDADIYNRNPNVFKFKSTQDKPADDYFPFKNFTQAKTRGRGYDRER